MMVSHQSIETEARISKMFKFVVLCAFVASAVGEADPGLLYSPYVQPYAAYSTVVSPGSTSISSQSSSVIHPSPVTYSAPIAFHSHFIKKRSAQYLGAPYTYNNYGYGLPSVTIPVAAPAIAQPITYTSAHLPLATHLIKKRSAPLLTTPYIAPTTYLAHPVISTPLYSTPYLSTPYYNSELPLVNAHFIKKRSAEPVAEPAPEPAADPQFLAAGYIAPTPYYKSYPAIPYVANPLVTKYYSPAYPLATAHYIKKRSAEPVAEAAAEPAAEPAADPLLAYPYPTPYYGGAYIPAYKTATLIKTSPIIATNPFFYSTYIKK